MTPRIQFVASPYALLAGSANQLIDTAGNAVLIPTTGGLTVTGTLTATAGFSGNGSALTALNGANITDGTIAASKLATITTAGKVANSATTATSANTANAIVARDGSGNFSAGTVTASAVNVNGLPAVAADAAFRIVAGSVSELGAITAGTGFTVLKINTGYYRISINNSSTTPFVTASINEKGPAVFPTIGNSISLCKVGPGEIDFFTFRNLTASQSSSAAVQMADKAFHFIALVPR
jgi:hypothetical protein